MWIVVNMCNGSLCVKYTSDDFILDCSDYSVNGVRAFLDFEKMIETLSRECLEMKFSCENAPKPEDMPF